MDSLTLLLQVHVGLSLVGIASGLVVLYGLLTGSPFPGWTALFLATTILTSVTGFMFPSTAITPGQIFGVISLIMLVIALVALYVFRLFGPWRWIYVVTALMALYLNCFVAVVQSFQKLPFLQPLAPTQSEPPFAVAQFIVLALFIGVGIMAARRFRPDAPPISASAAPAR